MKRCCETFGRLVFAVMLLTVLCVMLVEGQPTAFAAEGQDQGQEDSIGELSSRYASLEKLESATDDSDNVTTETRVGVLSSANLSLDGSSVTFNGEVVGDIMDAGDGYKWLNLLGDDGNSIGVFVTEEMAARVANVGGHSTTGSTLQVRGLYHLDCGEHQGELDVHATDIRVLEAGGAITHIVDADDLQLGLVLCGGAFALLLVFLLARKIMDWRSDKRDAEDETAFKLRRKSRKDLERQRREAREDESETR